jgi:phage protein U
VLYRLGGVTFEVAPLNTHEISRTAGADFAEKPVLGRRPELEFVGPGAEEWSFSGSVFPARFGGEENLASLDAAREAGLPLPLVRGDGVPHGWFVISGLRDTRKFLDARGVPQQIEYELSLKRSDPAEPGLYDEMMQDLWQ